MRKFTGGQEGFFTVHRNRTTPVPKLIIPGALLFESCVNTVESHINESHIKDKSHINDVQAAYQLLLYVLGSSHIKDKSHINDVFAADGQHR